MSLWAIIPAKDPWLAKSRLAGVLSPARRWSLSMQLLEHTLREVREAALVDRCLVVSSAAPQLAMARRFGAVAVHELRSLPARPPASSTTDPLNAALRQAAEVAVRGGATALLVLHADLLLLGAGVIDTMVRALPQGQGVVLAPDRHQTGTNALLMRPPLAIPFLFGPGSFAAHRRLAEALQVPLVIHESAALASDLDTPEDLAFLSASAHPAAPGPGGRRHPATPHVRSSAPL